MTTSMDLKIPSPPQVVPFENGGSPGQAAFLNQQAQINKQVALNKALAGGKKYKGGAAINVQTIPSPYTSVYGSNFINNEQLKNAGTTGQSQLNSDYDKYASIKGGKMKKSKRRKTCRKKASNKKRKTARKRRTYKK